MVLGVKMMRRAQEKMANTAQELRALKDAMGYDEVVNAVLNKCAVEMRKTAFDAYTCRCEPLNVPNKEIQLE